MNIEIPRIATLWNEYIPRVKTASMLVSRCSRATSNASGTKRQRKRRRRRWTPPEDQAERRIVRAAFIKAKYVSSSDPELHHMRATPAHRLPPEVLLSFLDPVTSRDYREVTREPFTETASASILLIEGSSGGGLPGRLQPSGWQALFIFGVGFCHRLSARSSYTCGQRAPRSHLHLCKLQKTVNL
jgi:hypothetical protein